MKENNREIKNLLETFMDAQTAGQMADDIRRADEMLAAIPAAKVSDRTRAAINDKVRRRLAAQKTRTAHIRFEKFIAAAAAIIIVAAMAGIFFSSNTYQTIDTKPIAASMIWQDSEDDPIHTLTGQVDTLSRQAAKAETAVQWLDENSSLTVEVDSIEEVALNSEFWKG